MLRTHRPQSFQILCLAWLLFFFLNPTTIKRSYKSINQFWYIIWQLQIIKCFGIKSERKMNSERRRRRRRKRGRATGKTEERGGQSQSSLKQVEGGFESNSSNNIECMRTRVSMMIQSFYFLSCFTLVQFHIHVLCHLSLFLNAPSYVK